MNLDMIKQAQQLKSQLEKTQKELEKTIIEADAGKGAVRVTVNGQQKILSIKISPDVINPEKVEYLEQLILKALHEANNKSQKVADKQLKGLTSGLRIPGLT